MQKNHQAKQRHHCEEEAMANLTWQSRSTIYTMRLHRLGFFATTSSMNITHHKSDAIMIKLKFTSEEQKILNYERYHNPFPLVQRKAEVIFLKSLGKPHNRD